MSSWSKGNVDRIDEPGADIVEASSSVVASVGRKFEPGLGAAAAVSRKVTASTVGQLAGKFLHEGRGKAAAGRQSRL